MGQPDYEILVQGETRVPLVLGGSELEAILNPKDGGMSRMAKITIPRVADYTGGNSYFISVTEDHVCGLSGFGHIGDVCPACHQGRVHSDMIHACMGLLQAQGYVRPR